MKKFFVLIAVFCAGSALFAQKVQESIIDFGKQQVAGYLVNVPSATIELVDCTFKEKMEKGFNLKSSKENGFRAYINQNMPLFGTENYDIYYKVSEFGKKKNKMTQLSLIVCSGNMNAITSQNNPETAEKIKNFLSDLEKYVQDYSNQQEISSLEEQLKKLGSEKSSLEKEQEKNEKQITKLQKAQENIKKELEKNSSETKKVEEQIGKLKKNIK